MNLNEFKAFIEGIEHAFGGEAPTAAQWQFIKDKLYQVTDKAVPNKAVPNHPVIRGRSVNPNILVRDEVAQFERESG